jgi:hypothetical protein
MIMLIARRDPVEVPAITSKSFEGCCPVRLSISPKTTAGMIPRTPPPSIVRILIESGAGCSP